MFHALACVCVERLKLSSEPKRNCCLVCCCKVTRSWNATFNSRFGGNILSTTFSSPSASLSRSFRVLNVFHPCVSWQKTAGTSSMSWTQSLMFKSNVPMLSGPDVVLPPSLTSCQALAPPLFFLAFPAHTFVPFGVLHRAKGRRSVIFAATEQSGKH